MLRLVAQLFVALAWVAFLPLSLLRRFWPLRAGTYVMVEIDGRVVDFGEARRLFDFGRPRATSTFALRKLVDEVAADDRVAGLLVVIKSMRGGMATATALRGVLADARAKRRDVVVHLPVGGGTKEYYVASAASRVLLGPQAHLSCVGFVSSSMYVKRALDRAGVTPEVYAQGEFKSAGETLVRDGMSDANREQVGAVLDGMHGALVGAIAEGRGVDRERASALVDDAPYHAARAVEAKLVDGVAYEDEVPARIGAPDASHDAHAKGAPIVFAGPYLASRRALAMRSVLRRPIIGVLSIRGVIAGGTPLPFGPMATDERIIATIRAARASRRVVGVVLRVDSPGGSALASDRIHHELVQLAAEKPLVACFGDVAASGGYYVAAAAHAIVAQPTTITGSIGVVATRIVLEPLLSRLGVVAQVVQRGARAHHLAPTQPFGEEDRAVIDRELAAFYTTFVGIVAAGRKRSQDEIDAVARGRVWTGADAHARGLVDVLGGFDAALDAVRARIGRGAARLEPAALRSPRSPLPPLDLPAKRAAELACAASTLLARAPLLAGAIDLRALAMANEPVLAYCREAITIR